MYPNSSDQPLARRHLRRARLPRVDAGCDGHRGADLVDPANGTDRSRHCSTPASLSASTPMSAAAGYATRHMLIDVSSRVRPRAHAPSGSCSSDDSSTPLSATCANHREEPYRALTTPDAPSSVHASRSRSSPASSRSAAVSGSHLSRGHKWHYTDTLRKVDGPDREAAVRRTRPPRSRLRPEGRQHEAQKKLREQALLPLQQNSRIASRRRSGCGRCRHPRSTLAFDRSATDGGDRPLVHGQLEPDGHMCRTPSQIE